MREEPELKGDRVLRLRDFAGRPICSQRGQVDNTLLELRSADDAYGITSPA